jgi:hypothetical protein
MKYNLSICGYCKDETDYLEEWVNFHRYVGVEHFYIYDNLSIIPVKETLDKYIKAGLVTVIDFPGRSRHMECYNYHLNSYKNDSKWTAFIDFDEFIVPKQVNSIQEVLKDYEEYGGLCINWVMFGTSGFKTKQPGLITETFTLSKPNLHTKTIVQSEFAISTIGNPHGFRFKNGYFSVSENFIRIDNVFSEPSINKIQLNHYVAKSEEEYKNKYKKVISCTSDGSIHTSRLEDDLNSCDGECVIEDKSAFRFIEGTKKIYL